MSISLKIKGSSIHYNEHHLLNGLDRVNQHPIEAITGLRDELNMRYIVPVGGIPSSDLAETYVSLSQLQQSESTIQALYAKCQVDINSNTDSILINETYITKNQNDIFNLTGEVDVLKSKINSLPGIDNSLFTSSVCIKQKEFVADDINKIFDIVIIDTDLKVIEPTILKSDTSLAKVGIDYKITYPDDVTLRIEFIVNDTYKVNYITGEITDSQFDVLLDYYKKLELELYKSGNGAILKPAHDIQLIYDDNGKVIKEIYTGNINKTIDYIYDLNNNVIKKTVVQGSLIKVANYQYDTNNNLVLIQDDGTDIPIDGTIARAFTCDLVYDINDYLIKETYSGDVNKTITYEYNQYGDVVKKTLLEDGVTKIANYVYSENRKLIGVNDSGTESIAVVFPKEYTSGGSGSGTSTDIGIITEQEIDLIFEAIFND